jgi:hypothetical protein
LRIEFSLCAFTGTPNWRFLNRTIGSGSLVAFDPCNQAFPAHQFPATERNGRDGRTAPDATGNGLADMRLGAVEQGGDIGESEKVEIPQPVHDAPPAE